MNSNHGIPLQNPANNDGRYFYETGRGGSFQIPITQVPAADWVPFEATALIARQPCWLTFIHVAVPDIVLNSQVYLLLWDVDPNTPGIDALIAAGMPSRYTLGPVPDTGFGGTIIYESSAEEVPCRVDPRRYPPGTRPPEVRGLPFNFGIFAAASESPRVWTNDKALTVAITARMQA